jgi:hypothetical protein
MSNVPQGIADQFSLTVGDFRIYEGATAFYIEHIPTSEERCMGDMVDTYFPQITGSKEFYGCLSADFMFNTDQFIEAYFGEIPQTEEEE